MLLLALWTACMPGNLDPSDSDADADTDADSDADTDSDTDADTDTDTDSDTDADPATAALCARWNDDRADLREGSWSGDLGSCDAGALSADGFDNTLRQVNLYRFIADLPPVTHDAGRDGLAQECALMMHANGTLSHSPPSGWDCYTSDGATGAASSNIASGPAVMAIDMYMQDWGNESTIGHRRWLLSNALGPIGIGSTDAYSCLYVFYGSGSGTNTWTAWPPPGVFPYQAVEASYVPLDDTGWTVQSDTVDVSGATVTVTRDDGVNMPVEVNALLPYYGSTYAVRFVPNGWESEIGRTYSVELSNVSTPIAYDVEIVDCDAF